MRNATSPSFNRTNPWYEGSLPLPEYQRDQATLENLNPEGTPNDEGNDTESTSADTEDYSQVPECPENSLLTHDEKIELQLVCAVINLGRVATGLQYGYEEVHQELQDVQTLLRGTTAIRHQHQPLRSSFVKYKVDIGARGPSQYEGIPMTGYADLKTALDVLRQHHETWCATYERTMRRVNGMINQDYGGVEDWELYGKFDMLVKVQNLAKESSEMVAGIIETYPWIKAVALSVIDMALVLVSSMLSQASQLWWAGGQDLGSGSVDTVVFVLISGIVKLLCIYSVGLRKLWKELVFLLGLTLVETIVWIWLEYM